MSGDSKKDNFKSGGSMPPLPSSKQSLRSKVRRNKHQGRSSKNPSIHPSSKKYLDSMNKKDSLTSFKTFRTGKSGEDSHSHYHPGGLTSKDPIIEMPGDDESIIQGQTTFTATGKVGSRKRNLNTTTFTMVNAPKKVRDNYVIDLVEIPYLKIIATASTDKQIRIWDMRDPSKAKVLFCLNMVKGGVHQIKYFQTYQVLLVAGYENSIPVFSITPKYYDLTVIGRLVGHLSIVTAIDCLEGSPMVLSADDNGCIKTWDIRSLQCYQTIELSHRTIINKLFPMENIGKISFIGCRVNFLEFDPYEVKQKKSSGGKMSVYPIRAELNMDREEIVVCTRSDLRFISMKSGRVTKIFSHLINSEEHDELTDFKLIQKNHKFILTDHRGVVNIYAYNSGERVNVLEPHQSEITGLKIDNFNKLYVTTGNDSVIKIQRELIGENKVKEFKLDEQPTQDEFLGMTPKEILKKINHDREHEFKKLAEERRKTKKKDDRYQKFKVNSDEQREVLRTIVKVHKKKEINILALSVYHNIIATASFENQLILYDYEFCRLAGRIVFAPGVYVTAMEFINGYGIMMVATSDCKFYLMRLSNTGMTTTFEVDFLGWTNPDHHIKELDRNSLEYEIEWLRFLQENPNALGQKPKRDKAPSLLFPELDIEEEPEIKNPYKDRLKNLENRKKRLEAGEQVDEQIFVDKIHIDLSLSEIIDKDQLLNTRLDDNTENIKVDQCQIIMCLNTGFVVVYELKEFLEKFKVMKHSKSRANYNAYRLIHEDYSQQISTNSLKSTDVTTLDLNEKNSLNKYKENHFFAHYSSITSVKIIKVPEVLLLTTSTDKYIKILRLNGEVVAAINMNHPLPLKWELEYDKLHDTRNKVLFGLKVIETIFNRYYNMLYMEGKVFDLKAFLDQYRNQGDEEVDPAHDNLFQMTQIKQEKKGPKDKVILMQDEYKPKDFAIGRMSKFYRQDLTGLDLKQLEAKRRTVQAHEEWKANMQNEHKMISNITEKKVEQKAPFFDDLGENIGFKEDDDRLSYKLKRAIKYLNEVKANTDQSDLGMLSSQLKDEFSTDKIHDLNRLKSKYPSYSQIIESADYKGVFEVDVEPSTRDEIHKKSTTEKKESTQQKEREFYRYASTKSLVEKKLIDKPKFKLKSNVSTDIGHQKVRKQHATKERNFERKRFSKVLVNLEGKLKSSQLGLVRSKNLSLPQLHKMNGNVDKMIPNSKYDYLFGKRRAKILRKKYGLPEPKFTKNVASKLDMGRGGPSLKAKKKALFAALFKK